MLSAALDRCLTRLAIKPPKAAADSLGLPTRRIKTPVGTVRLYDSGPRSDGAPSVIFTPDGPNVIEHYADLIARLTPSVRVVCFDMPGFGHSYPRASYTHSLDQGASAILGVLDHLEIAAATLAFSCANGFYALRAAQRAPNRINQLVLSQTPSLNAMHAWTARVVPKPIRIPIVGQLAAWVFRRKAAKGWYRIALPRGADTKPFQAIAHHALEAGACFCLAGVVQGLAREQIDALQGVTTPITMIWGPQDRSHKLTDPLTLLACAPHAEIIQFEECGHFPDLEQPERYTKLLLARMGVSRETIEPNQTGAAG